MQVSHTTFLKAALSACLLLPPSTKVAAQHWQLKFGGGLATQYGDSHAVGAYKLGVGYEYEFDQHWTISPGVFFYGKGWKSPDTMVPVNDDEGNPAFDEEGQRVYSRMGRSRTANYLEISVPFNYYRRIDEGKYWVLSAGPYVAYGVAGKIKTKGDGERVGSEKLFYEENTFGGNGIRRFDAGLQTALGYSFTSNLCPAGLTVGIEGDFGLTRTHVGGRRNLSGLVSITYTFQ